MKSQGIYYVGWSDKFAGCKRPDYLPNILSCIDRAEESSRLEDLRRVHRETLLLGFGPAFILGFLATPMPRKGMSAEKKVAMRRKLLRRRMEDKYPLFAAELEARALEENPSHFSVEVVAKQQESTEQTADLSEFAEAMTPEEALDFLRKVVVVPFVSDWINAANEQRREFLIRQKDMQRAIECRRAAEQARIDARNRALDADNFELR